MTVFDGDEAGEKERRDLQNYFGGTKIPFEANKHFVSVRSRFAIEGLFPDQWIIELQTNHPTWFDNFATDAAGTLEPFKIKDDKKSAVQSALIDRAKSEQTTAWIKRFGQVCKVIDEALAYQLEKLTAD